MTTAQEWWDRKSMGCLWPHRHKGSYSMTTTSVNKNKGSEDTFRVFHCFYCNVKSLFDFVICHADVCISKEKWRNFQMALPAHISSLVGRQCVCNQGVSIAHPPHAVTPVWEGKAGREAESAASISSFSIHSIWNLVLPWLEIMTGAKYFKTDPLHCKKNTDRWMLLFRAPESL